MFDSLLNRIILFLSVLVLVLGLFIAGIFVPPVFADSVDFPVLPYGDFSSYTSDMVWISPYGNFNIGFSTFQDITIYAFVAKYETSYRLFFASDSVITPNSSSSYIIRGVQSNGNYYSYPSDYGFISDLGFYLAFYSSVSVPSSSNTNAPFFESLDDALSSLYSYISSSTTFEPLYDGFNLPRGYLARITFRDSSVSDNNSVTFTSTFGNKSNAITGRFNSSQWYRFINTDLASIVLQYEDLGTKISWSPFGDHTTLGQYENGSFVLSGSSSTQLWLVNPVYQSYQINSLGVALAGHGLNGVLNNNVVIHDPSGIIEQIRIFPLSSGLVAGVDGVVNETNEDAYKDVNGSTFGAFTFTDSDGNITGSVPLNGATLVDDTTATSLDILNTIKNAFNDLINRLESIFHPAQGFFNTILGSFNDFVHWLSQLWSWLPTPIVGLIEAVLYISILVGCIKLIF